MSAPLDFSALKKTSRSSLEQLSKKVESLNQRANQSDDRIWKPTVNADGTGFALIRFLPSPKGEEVPFVRIFDHGFKGPGGWYIENSLTTLGKEDPVGALNSQLWNSGIESNKEIARKQKRRLNYYANIYVIDDKGNPENNGKTFLYKFGPKIFEKINSAMHPEFEDEQPFNPFDFWEGANFKLKIRNNGEYRSYDKSEFDKCGPLFDDDDKMSKIWEKQYSLQELVDPKNFKTYEELKAKLDKVLGNKSSAAQTNSSYEDDDDEDDNTPSAPVKSAKPLPEKESDVPWDTSEDDDEDEMAHFMKFMPK